MITCLRVWLVARIPRVQFLRKIPLTCRRYDQMDFSNPKTPVGWNSKTFKDRLDANRRAIECGSATPPRFTTVSGRFINGFCYLELLPIEWHPAAALTCGKFVVVSELLRMVEELWNDCSLVLGPTRDWRVSFGAKILSPCPGEDLVLHIERNGTMTFDECLAVLVASTRNQSYLVKVGGRQVSLGSSLNMVSCRRGAYTQVNGRLPSWALAGHAKSQRQLLCSPVVSSAPSVTKLSEGLSFNMRSIVEMTTLKTLVEEVKMVLVPAVPGKARLGYCSSCMGCFKPSRTAFSKSCRHCGDSARSLRERAANAEEILRFGLSVTGGTPATVRPVREVREVCTLVPIANIVRKDIVVLPTLPPGVGHAVQKPLPLQGEERVIAEINKLGKWSGLLHRLRSEGQKKLARYKRNSVPAGTKLTMPVLKFENRFDGLGDCPLDSAGSAPFFKGFTPVRKERVRRRVNTRFADWCERNVERKVLASQMSRPIRSSGRHALTLPSSAEKLRSLVGALAPNSLCGSWPKFFELARFLGNHYNCPSSSLSLFYDEGKAKVLEGGFGRGLTIFGVNGVVGHLGAEASLASLRFQSLVWKTLAKKNYLEASSKGVVLGPRGASLAGTGLICEKPNFFHQITNGFTVSVFAWKARIFSRGFDFSRKDDRPGQDGLITVRQHKLFWSTNGKQMFFTLKGMAKIFFRKGSDEKWRFAIARSVGMSLEKAHDYFSAIVNDEGVPDVVLEGDPSIMPSFMGAVAIVDRHVYVDVQTESQPKKPSAIVPPAPVQRRVTNMANGDNWLLRPGLEGKSNRSTFRHAFEDWPNRVSEEALKAMNQDMSSTSNYRPKYFQRENLVVNPTDNFDIHSASKKEAMLAPKSRNASGSFLDDIKKLRQKGVGDLSRPKQGFTDPRVEILKQKEKEFGFRTGKVVPSEHVDARDSTKADIETNPGPTPEDKLLVEHPTHCDVFGSSRLKRKHRRAASELITSRTSIVFSDGESPLDERFSVTDATPVEPISYDFVLSRNSSESDIECIGDAKLFHGGNVHYAFQEIALEERSQFVSAGPRCRIPHPFVLGEELHDLEKVAEVQGRLDSFGKSTEWDLPMEPEFMSMLFSAYKRATVDGIFSLKQLAEIAYTVKASYGCPNNLEFVIDLNKEGLITFWARTSASPRVVYSVGWDPMLHGADDEVSNKTPAVKRSLNIRQNFKTAIEMARVEGNHKLQTRNQARFDSKTDWCPYTNQWRGLEYKEIPADQLMYLYLFVWHFYHLIKATWVSFLRPDVERQPPTDDSTDNSECLLVGLYGTRGDIVPVQYFTNVARYYGVPTKEVTYNHMKEADLEHLRKGNFIRFLPFQTYMSVAADQGYKRTFLPHIETSPSVGHTYCLNPPSKYVRDTKFVDDWSTVTIANLIPAVVATLTVSAISHTWRIGSLSGCDLPRSVDGMSTLKRSQNLGKFEAGWTSGSADENVIPFEIRQKYPRIPGGDHTQIFRDYRVIHCHGGAGTVQTAIACGARPVVHDPTLDRDYHTMPTGEDFTIPQISSWLGWLVWSGFSLDAPTLVKVYWVACYFWHVRWSAMYGLFYNLAKLYAMVICLREHWVNLLIVLFVVPTIFWRIVHKTKSLRSLVKTVFAAFWNFPLLCLVQSSFTAVVGAWLATKIVSKGMVDYANSVCDKTRMVFEPVKRGKITFPFPFGHWSIYDVENDEVIEGHFTTQEHLLGSPFKFRICKRAFKEGYKTFPAPFNLYETRKLVNGPDNVEKPYSGWHNCSTFLTALLPRESFVWTVFSAVVTTMIMIALSPPDFLRMVMNRLFPGHDLDKNPLYLKLGFAAGIENIPFELEDEEMIPFAEEQPEKFMDIDFNDEQSYESLTNELSVIANAIKSFQPVTIDEEDLVEVMVATFEKEVDKVEIPEDSMVKVKDVPPYVKHTWAQIVDMIHHSISCVREWILIDTFVAWLKTITTNAVEFVFPILDFLAYFAFKAIKFSEKAFKSIFISVCHFLDHIWGLEASKRIKTVWGLTGLHRTGLLGVKMKLAASIAYSEYAGRSDFQSDYKEFCERAREYGRKAGATHTKANIGGPQRRPVGYSKPLMSTESAKLLGFNADEFVTDETYQSRIDSYLAKGVAQGADGVFLADKRPELIAKSQHRYEPKYAALTSDDRAIAKEIAQAMFDNNPEVFADCEIEPPKSVLNYIKKKYSPGTPFIKPGGFKSRQAIFDAGYDRAMQKKATDMLESGKYPVQMYHAFVKSQVVDIQKCLTEEEGGKNKDVRTVVSQDLFSYFQDQCLQLERNKRINWDTYGAGIGMPLNQSMATIFGRMADFQKERGGRYVIADATAFDSICKPFLFEVNANLWELGYKDHPSGNGKNIASVIRASYESRQNCWILGITEPEYDSLCVSIPDTKVRKKVLGLNNPKLVDLDTILDHQVYDKLTKEQKIKYVENLDPPSGKLIITSERALRPRRSNWMGKFEMTSRFELDRSHEKFFQEHTMQYDEKEFEVMYQDIKNIANSHFPTLSNVHPKNRGGSTGGSDTSNVNTHAFKAGVIYAWMKTTGRSAAEFYQYNMLCNTSDDTIWQTGGKHGLLSVQDVERFKEHCAEVGINLEIDTTRDINKVEYLSTLVRTPTKEDSAALKAWRSSKIEALNRSFKSKGREPPKDLSRFNNPRFLTYKNSKAVLLRRTDFRYYQSSYNKWRYTSIERGAGHGLNTAFLPDLYETFALEWCDDVNVLLKHYGIHRKYQVKNGRYDLQEVQQVDPRAGQQSLSPRQQAFLKWLKGCMFPSYYRVIDVHMNVAQVDPEQHSKFIKKLERGWRGWEEIMKEGVDALFSATDSIPDEWSKKFQPGITMMYGEQPFYTKNHYIEKFVYLRLLESTPEEQITFADFSLAIQESPYSGGCDPYYFWEKLGEKEFKEQLFSEDALKYQGLTALVSGMYMLTSAAEFVVLRVFFIGVLYKLFLWSFIGLNKVYGVTNTLYWHSTARSSKEISRIMPKDPYLTSKLLCIFLVDLLPDYCGYILSPVSLVLDCLPPMLESIGKTWWAGSKLKETTTPNMPQENPWSKYADEYVQKLRSSPTKRAYVAAKTGTGKSTMFIAALHGAKHRQRIRKIWLVEPRKVLRDNTVVPFGIPYQVLKAGIKRSESTDVYMLTYGHFQNRQYDVDPEVDIVLFDEFHERSGHMIMGLDTYRGPIFLLSATPVELPSLKESPFCMPSIDRRFPITIYKLPDSMSPTDMFMKARNLYPEQAKRALIVVPTKRMVKMVINQLDYLKVGKASPLTSTERDVAEDGIIVSTSIVDAGFDLKPGARMLINWGRTVNIDKGKFMVGKDKEHFPFTSKAVNQQRQGRVGRLEEGIVFECDSAGTGDDAITYPSPTLFQNQAVADFFKVPQLTPISGAVTSSMPFLRVNEKRLVNLQIQKSVCLIHALSLSDVNQQDWERFYTKKLQGHELGEDYEYVDKVCSDRKWVHTPLLTWELANYHAHRKEVVQYSINHQKKWLLPIKPIDGSWQEIETSPSHNLSVKKITEKDVESRYEQFAKSFDSFKNKIVSQSKTMDNAAFAKAIASMA